MTETIKDLPPPYPNQALARSKEISEVRPQKVVREKAQEAREAVVQVPEVAEGPSGKDADGSSDSAPENKDGDGRTVNLYV